MNDQPDKHQIRQILIQLHDMLDQAQAKGIDESDQALMRHLMLDIQAMLAKAEREDADDDDRDMIVKRMEDALTRLEVDHPNLTILIKKVVDTLSMAGI